MVWYLDTSAAVKLVRTEQESSALRSWIDGRRVVSSDLIRTELRRAVSGDDPASAAVERLLGAMATVSVTPDTFDAAGRLRGQLRSLDAIHLTVALDLGDDLDGIVTYDVRLATAAADHDLTTAAPS